MKATVGNDVKLELVSIEVIKKNVGGMCPTLTVEYEFVRRITLVNECQQRDQARNYFLGDYSLPILTYVSKYVYNNVYYQEIWGEYYEFISKENKQIPYYKLRLYANFNNSTLRHYVTAITVRHFVSQKMKEDRIGKRMISIDGTSVSKTEESEKDVIDNPWFNLLIGNDGSDDERFMTLEAYKKIEYVLSRLPERDVKVIKLMVMDDMSGLDAFEELKADLEKTARTPISTWTSKQKQDAMALQKARALKHFNKIVENEKIDF